MLGFLSSCATHGPTYMRPDFLKPGRQWASSAAVMLPPGRLDARLVRSRIARPFSARGLCDDVAQDISAVLPPSTAMTSLALSHAGRASDLCLASFGLMLRVARVAGGLAERPFEIVF